MVTSSNALRRFAAFVLLVVGASCTGDGRDTDREDRRPAARVAQALTDTDSDGMDDDWEIQYFGDLSQTGGGDFDSDGMTNGEEYLHGFDPTVDDGLDDADGDRYPNVFEVRRGSDPNDIEDLPTPNYVVNGAGGGTHTTVSAALGAAQVQNGAYQIIAIAPGVYKGAANLRDVTIASTKPKLLFIGLEGATQTIIDGEQARWGWFLQNTAVISSLTFQNTRGAFYVDAAGKEVRFVDLVVRSNTTTPSEWATPGLHVTSAAKTVVVGSTFLNNTGVPTIQQVRISAGAATLVNTVIWSQTSGTMLGTTGSATLTTNHCLVKGQTLTGTGNLAGSVNPKLHPDGHHLLWDSPLRGAGGTVAQSRIDIDGELRPSTAPDIGVDQFVDTDADELADHWELEHAGDLTTLTSRTQDADSDGLTNEEEYASLTDPTVSDTDGDGLSDGDEVTVHGTNPLSTDTDGDDMPDAWEVAHGLSAVVANTYDDDDGDRYPNVFEYVGGTDPSDLDSKPTPNFVVNSAGGGTHTTVGAAVSAANAQGNAFPIIGIAPGVYSGAANRISLSAPTKKFLILGLEGAAKTIVDGGGSAGWTIYSGAVISALTFQKTSQALYVSAPSSDVRLVDLLVRDNTSTNGTSGVVVGSAARVEIVGSTFLNNTGSTGSAPEQISINYSTAKIANTVVWGQTSRPMIATAVTTLTTSHCLMKGHTLSGPGNLSGTVNPKLRPDGRIPFDSPLRSAGGTASRIDMDGELRPTSAPDIGVDQFVDSDADDLADVWELAHAGNLTTLASGQDADSDGLPDEGEFTQSTDPTESDTDGDTLSDGDEVSLHGTNPLSADTDGDGMPDAWEVAHGFAPLVDDGFDDADGDRYPNVFEFAGSSDPNDSDSMPAPTYVVNGAGGGTHTTVSAALSAANVQNGAYQIIGLAPGVYTGHANLRGVTVTSTKPKLLFIGLEGAGRTIIDGERVNWGWLLQNSAVISSLSVRNTRGAFFVDAPAKEVRFVDLRVQDNTTTPTEWATPGLHVASAAKVNVVGSTFLDNSGAPTVKQIYVNTGAATLVNTVVWGQTSGTMLAKGANATLTTNYCLVKGQTLSGTGNLAGSVDPKLLSDAHLRPDSPLRAAGGAVAQSRIDIDGELRPTSTPDIGVDQFNDADADGLPDAWEVTHFGHTSTTSGTADDDDDELNNIGEYNWETDPLNPDTDGDGASDGFEVAHGMNPRVGDVDDMATDMNQDGLLDSIGFQLGYHPLDSDNDDDSLSNEDEALMCTNPLRADTDGDGVADGADAFPHDPLMSALPSNPEDVTAPVITLTAPWYAVEQ